MNRIQEIAELVASAYGVTVEGLRSRSRKATVGHPRQVAMYLIRETTVYSLQTIGTWFGGRDHTTVMSAISKVRGLVDLYPEEREMVSRLLRVIRADIMVDLGDGSAIHTAPDAKEIYITIHPLLT